MEVLDMMRMIENNENGGWLHSPWAIRWNEVQDRAKSILSIDEWKRLSGLMRKEEKLINHI